MKQSELTRLQKQSRLILLEKRVESLEKADKQLRGIIYDLVGDVRELQRKQEREEDKRGYAEQGTRYNGSHPSSCACDRCLNRMFPR